MIYYNRINVSDGIGVNKASKKGELFFTIGVS